MYSNTDTNLDPASFPEETGKAVSAPPAAASATTEAREPVQVMVVGSHPGASTA